MHGALAEIALTAKIVQKVRKSIFQIVICFCMRPSQFPALCRYKGAKPELQKNTEKQKDPRKEGGAQGYPCKRTGGQGNALVAVLPFRFLRRGSSDTQGPRRAALRRGSGVAALPRLWSRGSAAALESRLFFICLALVCLCVCARCSSSPWPRCCGYRLVLLDRHPRESIDFRSLNPPAMVRETKNRWIQRGNLAWWAGESVVLL